MQRKALTKKIEGFTLIELIIVLVIIGLAASVTFISIGIAHKKAIIRDASKKFYLSLRQARVLSATRRIETAVIINPEGDSYSVVRVITVKAPEGDKKSYELIRKITLPEGITLRGDDISFYPLGGSSGGLVYIEDTQGRTYQVKVKDVTGKIRLKRVR
ncbi:MAG: prepilin-type N-terminal cleavage/methylation domain-containing protein [Nitrospirae bacterium]|nr:MAG: prepilin-type N-terminal cleavage/methylation domain-containing protein [Nitrospirota bacterium]